MKKYSYIIIDDDTESILKTRTVAEGFSDLTFVGTAANYQQGLNLILQHQPSLVFLEIDPQEPASNLSLYFINELYRYLAVLPRIVIITSRTELAYEAIQYGVFDYLLKPVLEMDLRKLILKLNRINLITELVNMREDSPAPVVAVPKIPQEIEKPLIICIKSYGDYRYLNAEDITYFQADNNSTDIYLNSGEMITAFKTLKHFENVLSYPFFRIHNSYIINRNYVARIHSGNSVCYIKNSSKKIPFSKTYRSNVDLIISDFIIGNYLEV
ncbi:LytR/AlgR family response regulator transcription factor [Flavobacterium poyangense]|uniref:LytR/AlgR family response regulator transcription factor n=1 Tax=Flavobacterium poyangense TaxID=2204302 RepID=UPI00141DC3F2|nr:LytTR family DNA-binding domain-containing protein [Flavobacterium sp. JXAS1]